MDINYIQAHVWINDYKNKVGLFKFIEYILKNNNKGISNAKIKICLIR